MQRLTEYAAFPLIAGALGAGGAFIATSSFGAGPFASTISGLAVFAAALSLRNWGLSRVERPLLAEELNGLHERVDSLQSDAVDLRELLTDLAAIVEEASAREHEALRAVAGRVRALETAREALREDAGEAAENAEASPEARAALERLDERMAQFEARTRKLALAMETAFGADGLTGREPTAREAAEIEAAEIEVDAAPEASPARGAADLFAAPEEEPALSVERITAAARAEEPPAEETRGEAAGFDEEAQAAARDHALLMQAVFSVPDGEPRFFEAYTRRFDPEGRIMPEADHIEPAKADGSIADVDNLLLVRSVAAAEQLRAAGRDVAIFCNLSVHSLRDPAYLRSLIGFLRKNQALSRNLVFEFSQLDLNEVFDPDIAALQRLQETGFAFSIDHLSDWSIDIAHLAKIGFRFVKLDAASLLSREVAAPGATRRLIKSFDRAGLTLVVEKVETLEEVAALRDAGAGLLQGEALSEPRLIQVEDEDFLALESAARRAMAAGEDLASAAAPEPARRAPDDAGKGASPKSGGIGGGGFEGAIVERALRSLGAFSPSGAPAHRRPD